MESFSYGLVKFTFQMLPVYSDTSEISENFEISNKV
jgi:hypothetical protein